MSESDGKLPVLSVGGFLQLP
eukprot:COSAG06_NODE_51077_length_314_cov_1.093023_2_plen_20_part_01